MSNKHKDSATAFPITAHCGEYGLTKRELIAAMAMQGIISAAGTSEGHVEYDNSSVAQSAAEMADALLAELAKG